ncbi:hypothetical protein [Arthrobacter sp. EPSL27]|uniref:hypothetical protein n=1 Tax=Arthrobacter sp. EPSL27 TaxID=1745378 RepID=UPI00074AC6B2|nr:hypothetical protein [Arthrobacter sp. EPSL27]KUM33549.1 hypothetical protein AR539_16670 [Arthrobacter sp. EPSL27]
MSNTNRALNRILLALAGLALLAGGAALAATGLVPVAAAAWTDAGNSLTGHLGDALAAAPLPGPARSWWAVAGVAGLVLAAGLCIAWLASQGGGRTPRLARESDGDRGTTVVDAGLIGAAVSQSLEGNRLVLGSTVSAWGSRRGTGLRLRLRLQARKGASPRELADTAEDLVRGIDALLGHPVPVLVRITGGAKSAVAGPDRAR